MLHWGGTRWRAEPFPVPSQYASDRLQSISCGSVTFCVATLDPYVWTWNGQKWARTTLPGGKIAPTAVSCTSSKFCMVIGVQIVAKSDWVLVSEVWNGSSWRVVPAADPGGGGALTAVSCVSVTFCEAVGEFAGAYNSSDQITPTLTFAERWTGSRWVLQTTPNGDPQGINDLASLACSRRSFCVAVGASGEAYPTGYLGPTNPSGPLAIAFDGTSWSLLHPPNYRAGGAVEGEDLAGVACFRSGALGNVCLIDGQDDTSTIFLELDGGTFDRLESVTPRGFGENGQLSGIACSPAPSVQCFAVGSLYSTTLTKTLIERD